MSTLHSILMVAAENDALPGAKVGGVADVVRDVPPALTGLANFDCEVKTVVPSYGFLHKLPGAETAATFSFHFAGARREASLYRVPGKIRHARITHYVLHDPRFEFIDPMTKRPRIYCDDPPDRPFATDATKYACYCAAVAEALKLRKFGDLDRLHLHDWHAALVLLLRRFDQNLQDLRAIPTVFTIHNLVLQGIRPFDTDSSSLASWYPHLDYDPEAVRDPGYPDCVNLMAVGIRLSDAVHVVSPTYAEEILKPSLPKRNHPACFYYGGEGLESDLNQAQCEHRLFGILNGCDYPVQPLLPPRDEATYRDLLKTLHRANFGWGENGLTSFHLLALQRLERLQQAPTRPRTLLTSVTRVVDQKVKLMCPSRGAQPAAGSRPAALERILEQLDAETVYIFLGTGDREYERYMLDLSYRFPNFVFLHGYSDVCSSALYANGDLFLMPSSFEPCGITQMLAMRAGQPCVVHAVGGLKDTVQNGVNGFSFAGGNEAEQAQNFVATVLQAIDLKRRDPARFRQISSAAFGERFLWSKSVREYVEKLYQWRLDG